MVCVSYLGLVGLYVLVGLLFAWQSRKGLWRFLKEEVRPNDSFTVEQYYYIVCLINWAFWPVFIFTVLGNGKYHK